MASILRTGKFLRCFAGLTRNVFINNNTIRDTETGNLLQNSSCMCSQFQLNFSSNVAPKADLTLEKQLHRLDHDVRRMGRISRRDIEEVLEEIRSQHTVTSSQSLMVIRCCGNLVPEELPEVRTALVQEIWKTLNTLNVPMDISHYNALLRVYLENEHPFSPTDFLAEIEAKSIEPNRVTYQRLISRYCQNGDIDGATKILEYMREKNLPVNENVFNSLILGHSQANDLESAKGILGMMKQAGLEPSADTYTTLLCCYARHGDIESLLSTLEECEKKEIYLLDKDILDVVYTLTVNGHGEKVDAILKKLRLSAGFNQDAVNIILRLVNRGHEDICLKILRIMPRGTRPDGQAIDVGTFFIKQLVKANRPVEKVLSICKILKDEGLNTKALLIATEAGLNNGLVSNTLPLLKEMKNAGLPIRQHYFWPLICSVESNQVIDIVRRMQEEFSLFPNAETIRDYVIPNMKEKNWEKILQTLRDAGVSNNTAASAAAYTALTENKLKDTAIIMESHNAIYTPAIFKKPLVQALAKTNDYASFIRIVRQLYESVNRRQNRKADNAVADTTPTATSEQENSEVDPVEEAEETIGASTTKFDVVGSVLIDVTFHYRSEQVKILESILPLFVEQGLSISSANATRITERLGAKLTSKISELLGVLSSGDLELLPLKNSEARKRGLDQMTVDELERFIANVEAKGENSNNLKRFLLNACFRSKNLEKTLQVVQKLESENYSIHSGVWAQLIDLYVQNNRVSDALTQYNKIKEKEPSFLLDNLKTARTVDALLKEERFDDAIKFLEQNKKPEPYTDEGSYDYISTVWRILNTLAEAGNAEKLQRLFDTLLTNNYIQPNNVLLGPLIKVHLICDDIQKAIDTFEQICEKYRATPWKNELACRLIQREDATNLQRLTDLSTQIHGEVNSLYDLVFSFVECGRVRQARKILETPGLHSRPHRLANAVERYKDEGMVQSLESLVEATKDLNHIDRTKIFYNLLLSYIKSEDAGKALDLWTKMQEENVTPSDLFLIKLAELLKKKNIEVPFVVPLAGKQVEAQTTQRKTESSAMGKTKATATATTTAADKEKPPTTKSTTHIQLFRRALNSGDNDEAIANKEKLKANGENVNPLDVSRLIENLCRADRIGEATKFVNELLAAGKYPQPKIFRFFLNKLAATGDYVTMEQIGAQLDSEKKKLVSYDNRYCHANLVAGKGEQYFKQLNDEISAVRTAEEAAQLAAKFPRGGAVGILEKHPEFVPQYENLAEKYAEHKQLGPINVLWMYHMSHGNEVAAKIIWDKHLSTAPRLMFQRVLQTAREQNDDKLAEIVLNQLRDSKISEGAIGNAYSCLVDILTNNAKYDKAMDVLKNAVKDVCLEHINRTALIRLKQAVEADNKPFPYTIPERKIKNVADSTSSSQSSDDDVAPKRPETRPSKPTNETAQSK